jgi:NTE family protein
MRALVLGGGGVTGVAWELGLLAGLAERGVDLTGADLVVGTSAGSVVGAEVATGVDIEERYAKQLLPPNGDVAAALGPAAMLRFGMALLWPRATPEQVRARVGRLALRARTMPEADRLAVFAERLPVHEWPDRALKITAVDARSGEFMVFDRASGVPLVTAVAASCAVPGIWPPVTADGRRYVDGGVRSPVNADLAAGYERVIVIAPIIRGFGPMVGVRSQLDELRKRSRVALVSPAAAALRAIGRNVLDPARRADAARAGRAQAVAVAEQVAEVWAR